MAKTIAKLNNDEIVKPDENPRIIIQLNRKLNIVNDLSSGQYFDSKNIRFKNLILRSDLYDQSNGYIFVNRRMSLTGNNNTNRINKKLTFNKNALFRSTITSTFIVSAEDLDIVVSINSLIVTIFYVIRKLLNYRDEVGDDEK